MVAHRPPAGFPAAVYALVTDQSERVLIVQPPGTGAPWRLCQGAPSLSSWSRCSP
ncbi:MULTISPECIES: hypothetical protein [Streptomyces]|uniref:hypothetical protein n=1 Tax=Streptomyces TaxID=1883 RepID=UPI000A8E7878|nr:MULTISPECIES: hypothetical protein [Streptomyces]MDI6410369.1 hypothetical protein [Streptomyces albus]